MLYFNRLDFSLAGSSNLARSASPLFSGKCTKDRGVKLILRELQLTSGREVIFALAKILLFSFGSFVVKNNDVWAQKKPIGDQSALHFRIYKLKLYSSDTNGI